MHQDFGFRLFTFEHVNELSQLLLGIGVGNRRAEFDVFDAEAGQGLDQLNFLIKGKMGAAKLFSLTQGGIENLNLFDTGASPVGGVARICRAVNYGADNRPPL